MIRARILELAGADRPPEVKAALARFAERQGNLIGQLLAVGFDPAVVLRACAEATGLGLAAPGWDSGVLSPAAAHLDDALCARLPCVAFQSPSQPLCVAYGDPEAAAARATLGLPDHLAVLALPGDVEAALQRATAAHPEAPPTPGPAALDATLAIPVPLTPAPVANPVKSAAASPPPRPVSATPPTTSSIARPRPVEPTSRLRWVALLGLAAVLAFTLARNVAASGAERRAALLRPARAAPEPPAGLVAPGHKHEGLHTDDLAARQQELLAAAKATRNRQTALLNLSEVIRLDAGSEHARDALLQRAQLNATMGALDAAEADLRTLKRRPDAAVIEGSLRELERLVEGMPSH